MFSTDDTIVAVATPPGRGGIGVVRISGPDALAIAQRLIAHDGALEARRATYTRIRGMPRGPTDAAPRPQEDVIDQAVVTYFAAPASYTGEHVVEISVHGSPVVLRAVVTCALSCGARLAEPGEFTLRAYLNGRLDLMQAEAVADLVDAVTPLQARVAFDQLEGTLTESIRRIDATLFDLIARLEASVDFPDEGYHFGEPAVLADAIAGLIQETETLIANGKRGRLIREGFQVAIVGPPNVGKSSLFNALVGADRAIVTDIPGTTRDLVTELMDLNGFPVTVVDTAGLRTTEDKVEVEGVARSRRAAAIADVVLVVADGSVPGGTPLDEYLQDVERAAVVVQNKVDLGVAWSRPDAVMVSTLTGAGLTELRERILASLDASESGDRPQITNVRQISLVELARAALQRAHDALATGPAMPEEFVLADLQEARSALEEVTGKRTSEDLLEHIFARFCIGK